MNNNITLLLVWVFQVYLHRLNKNGRWHCHPCSTRCPKILDTLPGQPMPLVLWGSSRQRQRLRYIQSSQFFQRTGKPMLSYLLSLTLTELLQSDGFLSPNKYNFRKFLKNGKILHLGGKSCETLRLAEEECNRRE